MMKGLALGRIQGLSTRAPLSSTCTAASGRASIGGRKSDAETLWEALVRPGGASSRIARPAIHAPRPFDRPGPISRLGTGATRCPRLHPPDHDKKSRTPVRLAGSGSRTATADPHSRMVSAALLTPPQPRGHPPIGRVSQTGGPGCRGAASRPTLSCRGKTDRRNGMSSQATCGFPAEFSRILPVSDTSTITHTG